MKAFLVDVDGVLFDTEKIRPFVEKGLSIDEIKPYFKEFIFPDSLEIIESLKKLGHVIIFSGTEDLEYQRTKLIESGILDAAGEENVVITLDKHGQVKPQVEELKTKGYDQIYIIDDRVTIMEKAYGADPQTIRILVSYGKYQNTPIENPDIITQTVESIADAYDFINTFLDSLGEYKIKKGITEEQITELINYSNSDLDVQKNTLDADRFKDRKNFDEWIKKGKDIYTLVDKDDNLMGIIWFHQALNQEAPGYETTFAIRMYEGARGKGLSKPFMEKVFSDFGAEKIWLSTLVDNIPGRKLYEHFGFKQITQPDQDNRIIMIYG